MAATIVDIAREAGVGEATVVRALRGTGYVSAATKARIEKVAARLNYHPNHVARSLALGTSEFVGMVLDAGFAPALKPFLSPIEQGIRNAGYSMLFYMSSGTGPDAELRCFRELLYKRIAGAIIAPNSLTPNPEPYRMLIDNGIKIVTIDINVDGLKAPQIVCDHYQSAKLATEHLISLGHRDIVYLAIPRTSHIGRERARGFQDTMTAAGIQIDESSIVETPDHTEEAGAEATLRLLERRKRPTAVVARLDTVAIGVMQTVLAAGLSIPEDISLVGHGDHGLCHALRVPLTTIHAPIEQMASLAVRRLLDMLAGKTVKPVTEALAVELVVRSSTGPAPR